MQISFDRIFGMICIVFGLFVVIVTIGDLIMRILLALLGLFLVNFGLKLRGVPSLTMSLMRMWSGRYDF